MGFIRVFFLVVIFVLIWSFWLGRFINEWTSDFLSKGYVTGIEAFLWANLNLWIMLLFGLGIMIYVYLTGGQR